MLIAGVPHSREQIDLWRLAHRCGVKPAFIGSGLASLGLAERKQRASPEALLAALRSLGISIEHPKQARETMRAVEQQQWRQVIEPIIVLWQGERAQAMLRLTDQQAEQTFEVAITCEGGEKHRFVSYPADRVVTQTRDIDGVHYCVVRMPLPDDPATADRVQLPIGYHTLKVTIDSNQHSAKFFVAPGRAMAIQDERAWGVFLPLYALRSRHDWGVGDLTDLRDLLKWTRERGGSLVGTLPLLASYLDQPCDPSPYTPVSRLFFNELYLDVDALMTQVSDAAGREANALQSAGHVDFAQAMTVKRRIMEPLAEAAFADSAMRAAIERAADADPYLAEYARFRAVVERHGADWHAWPSDRHTRIKDEELREEDADPRAIRYHLYVQTQLRRQLGRIANDDRAPGRGLYLDLPVGVHLHGYDAWRFADCFATGAACGAPPDELFIGGQSWGFAPLHPHRSRAHGHEWFIQAIRRHLEYAGLLRVDHVMWLHRMYWVPSGFPATDGVYVRNPSPEELYAVLTIESHRHNTAIVGENLGTVPDIVNRTMRRRGIHSLAVGQFLLTSDAERPLPELPVDAVASMNTHDTPTFAGFWKERDIDQRVETGLLDEEKAAKQRSSRAALRDAVIAHLRMRDDGVNEQDIGMIAAKLLKLLCESDAAVVLATLEDLWQEEQPQNIPGTTSDRNWSRRTALTMEEMCEHPAILAAIERIDRVRRRC